MLDEPQKWQWDWFELSFDFGLNKWHSGERVNLIFQDLGLKGCEKCLEKSCGFKIVSTCVTMWDTENIMSGRCIITNIYSILHQDWPWHSCYWSPFYWWSTQKTHCNWFDVKDEGDAKISQYLLIEKKSLHQYATIYWLKNIVRHLKLPWLLWPQYAWRCCPPNIWKRSPSSF